MKLTVQPCIQPNSLIPLSGSNACASAYVKTRQTKIVLINGQELADLMIEYGVGVIDAQTYRVRRVHPAYFGE